MLSELIEIFETANMAFRKQNTNLFDIKISERTLCGALMLCLHEELKNTKYAEYYVDVEFNRDKGGRIKTTKGKEEKIININCDLVMHGRGENLGHENLIAIEMKKDNQLTSAKNADRDRLIALTSDPHDDVWSWDGTNVEYVCGYKLGVYYEIEYRSRRIVLEYYAKGERIEKKNLRF